MLTNNPVVLQEDIDSLNTFYSDPSLSLEWNLVFTLPAWLKVWWKHFSSGAELYLRSVRQNGQIIGIAPLQIRNGVASIIGNMNVSDYQDFILSPGYERDFYTAILDDLKKKNIQKLRLETVRPDSTIVTFLLPLLKTLDYKVDYHQIDVSSDIKLPVGWDQYLKVLDSKQRHELKRKLRNLQDIGETNYRIIKDKSEIPRMVDTFLHLFPEARKDKAEFLTKEMENFFRSLAISLSEQGIIGFGSLETGGKPLAMVMYFDYNENIYLYNSAYDPHYKSFSVGIISKALCIQESILERKTRFDFLKGSEQYKYYLGGQEIPLYSCEVILR